MVRSSAGYELSDSLEGKAEHGRPRIPNAVALPLHVNHKVPEADLRWTTAELVILDFIAKREGSPTIMVLVLTLQKLLPDPRMTIVA